MPGFNLDLLALHLKDALEEQQLSMRAAAGKIECSPATLSRLLQGTSSPFTPDSENLLRAVRWLRRDLSDFTMEATTTTSSIADVEVHLRALPGLSAGDAEALVAMVKAAYRTVRLREQKGAPAPKPKPVG
jgi:transcriptional regulator with XRE-family HTH domain